MTQLAALISLLLTIYALGLMVYVILSWAHHPHFAKPRQWLETFYTPFLTPLRKTFKPANVSGISLDYAPVLLFLSIWIVREIVVRLLLTSIP